MNNKEQHDIIQPGTLSSGRLLSLDVFRGITIIGMILVNNPGTWSHVYPPLLHAEWHGCTFTDLIFPFFLFIVGMARVSTLLRFERINTDLPPAARGSFEKPPLSVKHPQNFLLFVFSL